MSFLASVHLTIYVTLPSSRAEIRIQQTGGPHLHVYGINRRLPHFHLYRSFYGVATAQFEIHTPYAQPGDWNDLIPRAHLREAGATVGQLEMHPISDTRGRITISFQPVDTGPDGLRKLLEDLIESVVQDDFLPGTRQDDWVVAVSRFHHEFFPRDPVATPLLVRDSPLPPNSDASNSGSAPSEENSMERSYRVWEESTRIFARCTKMDDRFRPLGEPVKFSSTVKLFKKDLKQLTKLSKQISEGSYLYCFIQGEMTHLNGIAQSENTWLRTGVQGFQQRAAAGDCILSLDASLYCNTNGIIVPLDLKRAGSLANHLGGIFPLGPGYLDFQRKFFQLNANIPEEMSHVPRHEDLEIPDSEVPALTEKLNQSFHRIDQLLSIGLPHSPAFLLQLGMKNFNFLTLLTNTNQEIAPIHSLRTSYLLHQTIQQLSELPVPDTEDQAQDRSRQLFLAHYYLAMLENNTTPMPALFHSLDYLLRTGKLHQYLEIDENRDRDWFLGSVGNWLFEAYVTEHKNLTVRAVTELKQQLGPELTGALKSFLLAKDPTSEDYEDYLAFSQLI